MSRPTAQHGIKKRCAIEHAKTGLTFLGPRQMTADVADGSKKPTLITARLSSTYTGDQPVDDLCTFSPSTPMI
jgi:hypothetical protein